MEATKHRAPHQFQRFFYKNRDDCRPTDGRTLQVPVKNYCSTDSFKGSIGRS